MTDKPDGKRNLEYRRLTDAERTIGERLLSQDFPGRDELLVQWRQCRACTIDEDGGLAFMVDDSAAAPVSCRIPVEARYVDRDGMEVSVLLHVVAGKLNELEIYRSDSKRIIDRLDISKLEIWVK